MRVDSAAVVGVIDQTEKFRVLSATASFNAWAGFDVVPTDVAIELDRPTGAVS